MYPLFYQVYLGCIFLINKAKFVLVINLACFEGAIPKIKTTGSFQIKAQGLYLENAIFNNKKLEAQGF